MPQTAQYVLALRANPDATARDILRIVEQDPSLAAKWCIGRVPLHSYQGPVDSLKTAIEQVLGFENTLNLLLDPA
ncbi:MAG: HDOD domain-containing protein [Candidatus Competibacteraceae bacterium]|nr:HDOD domain-containing protein [Candidatus Competibacteraceae bacterium]